MCSPHKLVTQIFLYMSYLHLWLASESSPYMLEAKKRTRCQQPKLSQPVQSFVVKRKTELILKVQKVAQFSVIMIIHMLSELHHLKNIFYLNKTCILWHTMEQILLLLKIVHQIVENKTVNAFNCITDQHKHLPDMWRHIKGTESKEWQATLTHTEGAKLNIWRADRSVIMGVLLISREMRLLLAIWSVNNLTQQMFC